MPSESHPSEAERVLPFIVPYDPRAPEIEDSEKEVVRERFDNLVSDIFLNHAGGSIHGRVLLGREDGAKADTSWSLAVQRNAPAITEEEPEEDSAEVIPSEVSIQKKMGMTGRDIFIYRLGEDGTVERFDRGDVFAEMQSGANTPSREQIQDGDYGDGPTYHPIGLTEMEGLKAFITQPGWEIPESYAVGVATIIGDRQAMRAPDFPPEDL
jgi:hypothetical protein